MHSFQTFCVALLRAQLGCKGTIYVSFHISPYLCVCVRVREAEKRYPFNLEFLHVIRNNKAECDLQKKKELHGEVLWV